VLTPNPKDAVLIEETPHMRLRKTIKNVHFASSSPTSKFSKETYSAEHVGQVVQTLNMEDLRQVRSRLLAETHAAARTAYRSSIDLGGWKYKWDDMGRGWKDPI
jgi:hypothetical protein